MPDQPWRPSRATTILIGAVSVWPILYMGFFMGSMLYLFSSFGSPATRNSGMPDLFRYIFVLHLLTILLMFILMAVYIVHAFRTDSVPQDKKVLWVLVLFFGNIIAFPIYWYFYMWRPLRSGDPGQIR